MSEPNPTSGSGSAEHQRIPLVGVVVPVHNHKQYIEGCINSIIMQDYPNKMVVIVDDGSTDGSYDFIRGLFTTENTEGVPDDVIAGTIHDLPACLLRNEEAKGPSAARNKGIEFASTSCHIFGVLDSDDQYLPDKLSKSVWKMMEDPERIGLVYSDVLLYDEDTGTYVREYRQPYNRKALMLDNTISNAPLINRQAIVATGGYDEELRTCEDWDLWLRITETFLAVHIPEALQVYRIQDQSATVTINETKWARDRGTVIKKLQAQLHDKQS